jgi:hypothetical protein
VAGVRGGAGGGGPRIAGARPAGSRGGGAVAGEGASFGQDGRRRPALPRGM